MDIAYALIVNYQPTAGTINAAGAHKCTKRVHALDDIYKWHRDSKIISEYLAFQPDASISYQITLRDKSPGFLLA